MYGAHEHTGRTRSLTPKFGVLLVGIRGNLNPRLSIREINMKEGQPVKWLLVVPVANLVVPVANAQPIVRVMSSPSRLPDKLLARSLYSLYPLELFFHLFARLLGASQVSKEKDFLASTLLDAPRCIDQDMLADVNMVFFLGCLRCMSVSVQGGYSSVLFRPGVRE